MPRYARQDYEQVARILNHEVRTLGHEPTIKDIQAAFIDLFEADNPKFDKNRFVREVWR